MNAVRSKRSNKIRWAVGAVSIVAVLIAGPTLFEKGPHQAYAAAVRQVREAKTMTYVETTGISADLVARMPDWLGKRDKKEMQPTRIEAAYKAPGLTRLTFPDGSVWIDDPIRRKSILLAPSTKECVVRDFMQLPPKKNSQLDLIGEMQSLPERANESLGKQEIDGRKALGFRVTEEGQDKHVWIDAETGDLLRIEGRFVNVYRGMKVVLSDFRFDVELDDALFSVEPPEGYSTVNVHVEPQDPANEEGLVRFLEDWALRNVDRQFPPTLHLWDLARVKLKMDRAGKTIRGETGGKTEEQSTLEVRGTVFLSRLQPDNDWHYAGRSVTLGAADRPIFWYRPEGSATYRVIYGDLGVREMAPEEAALLEEFVVKAEETTLEEIEASLIPVRDTVRDTDRVELMACQHNLAKLRGAKEAWKLANADLERPPTWDDLVGPRAYIGHMPECPSGGTYSINPLGQNPTCTVPGHELP